jgi:hypothetical protein
MAGGCAALWVSVRYVCSKWLLHRHMQYMATAQAYAVHGHCTGLCSTWPLHRPMQYMATAQAYVPAAGLLLGTDSCAAPASPPPPPQVETQQCFQNIDEVLAVPGITCAFLGERLRLADARMAQLTHSTGSGCAQCCRLPLAVPDCSCVVPCGHTYMPCVRVPAERPWVGHG